VVQPWQRITEGHAFAIAHILMICHNDEIVFVTQRHVWVIKKVVNLRQLKWAGPGSWVGMYVIMT